MFFVFSFTFLLNDTTSRRVGYQNSVTFKYASDNLQRDLVTFTVTLCNKTSFSAELYNTVLSNDPENISLTFEIKERLLSRLICLYSQTN